MSALEEAVLELDNAGSVKYFTDYLKVLLHPKSVVEVPDYWQRGEEAAPFGSFRLEPEFPRVSFCIFCFRLISLGHCAGSASGQKIASAEVPLSKYYYCRIILKKSRLVLKLFRIILKIFKILASFSRLHAYTEGFLWVQAMS